MTNVNHRKVPRSSKPLAPRTSYPVPHVDRRKFLKSSTGSLAALSALSYARAADAPSEKVTLALIGIGPAKSESIVNGRGRQLLGLFTSFNDVEIASICDPDENLFPSAQKVLTQRNRREARVEKDIRRVLQDKTIDAVIVATPDHWHALATIWACQAGKHVFVEKPASHNLVEGRRMVEAARKYNRVVQHGTQSRSSGSVGRAAELIRSGKLGKIPAARIWVAGARRSIGHVKDSDVPKGVDYDLWLGPAPRRPFNENRFHYRWHWMWDFGSGEIGNNGVHYLDRIRWLLNLDAPTRIVASGGKLFYDDDQETPDTLTVSYDFPHCNVTWEHRIWSRGANGTILYGERGNLIMDRHGWHVENGIEAADKGDLDAAGMPDGSVHQRNFIDCIKNSSGTSVRRPNADIEEGHKSTRLCHLGNIAFRTGRAIRFDEKTETCINDPEANRLLGRTYRKPFEVPERV
ncbi:MAG TPA: Gfo/Idh/MocA family oxidoreductase [Gemmataceae bacterium]|nr:Gfo/Idh/MocA family oxidoreductase [Gemmataceae bacterium]